jgi:hypothetical protein
MSFFPLVRRRKFGAIWGVVDVAGLHSPKLGKTSWNVTLDLPEHGSIYFVGEVKGISINRWLVRRWVFFSLR